MVRRYVYWWRTIWERVQNTLPNFFWGGGYEINADNNNCGNRV